MTISVVTPSLNQGRYIEECIVSVRAQLGPDAEHIVIDGGSTDGTVEILGKYPHLRWVSEPDRGQADALNKGFKMATGEIVGWLNADDAYLESTLAVVRRFFCAHPEVILAYGYVYVVDSRSRRIRKRYSPDFDFGLMVRNGECYAQPTFFFRRSIVEVVGYLDPTHRWGMDYDLILRCGRHGGVRRISEFLGVFRTHPGSMSHSGCGLNESMLETARSIQAMNQPFVQSKYPELVYRIHDKAIMLWFKAMGRVASLPMHVRYRLSNLTRGA